MEKWFIKNKKIDHRVIARNLGINEIISKLLVNRDIVDKEKIIMFLNPELDKLHSPTLMKDLALSVDIINNKIKGNEKIRIVGDFDVDGVMSVYILYQGLKRLGANVDYVIPDRVIDGYGINNEIVTAAKKDGVDTLITCDNGIAAIEQISLAKDLGLTVIVTDHHDIPYKEVNGEKTFLKSTADAIVNPKQLDCNYPFKLLCGAGVVFKLINFLFKSHNIENEALQFLEYAAIATICDVVDLVDENRIIVKNGLKYLSESKNIGLKALINECGIKLNEISVYHVGFIIGPSINASGRLDTALYALDLLLTKDNEIASEMAKNLRELNEERKILTSKGIERIKERIESSDLKNDKVLVIYDEEIHESIAGIIAGRIKEYYNKPTIVLTEGIDGPKGSGRSIEDYNMFEELSKCKDLLIRFGGHPMAAGLSLPNENIEVLRKRLNNNTNLTNEDLIPKIYIDMQLPIEYINYKLVDEMKILEPFGKGNVKPLFGEKQLIINRGFLLGINKNVLKLNLKTSRGISIEGLLFSQVDTFIDKVIDKYGQKQLENMYKGMQNNIKLDILYYPSINEYMGRTTLQVIINNFRLV